MTDTVAGVRRFNRFYTGLVGALDEGHLASAYTLAEARVLYELAHRDGPTSAELRRDLHLDAGYLSRIVAGFVRRGLVARVPSSSDGRRTHLHLTDAGATAFAELDARARADVGRRVAALPAVDGRRLLGAMRTIESLLGADDPKRAPTVVLRPPRPGDLGWVIARNGALYAEEFGWDASYEALVARIVADFARDHDPDADRCWIAERGGENVGCVFCVRHPERDGVARLRLLLVEPSARGLGVGRRLVEACVAFARERGYGTMTLWTNSVLGSARRIYEACGFRLVAEEAHCSFGQQLVGQTWELTL